MKLFILLFLIFIFIGGFSQTARYTEYQTYDGTEYNSTPKQIRKDNYQIYKQKKKAEKKLMRRNNKKKKNIEKLKKQGKVNAALRPCSG